MWMLALSWADVGNSSLLVLVWVVTGLLLLVGLVGTVVPMLPGPVLMLAAAIWHTLMLRYAVGAEDPGFRWPGFVILTLFIVVTQVLETASSALGAKYFGSTKWGAIGALIGGIVGLFFGLPGLIIGPLLGALLAELIIAGRHWKMAAKSSWGTFVGSAAGLVIKAILGLAMVGYFFLDLWVLTSAPW